MLNPDIICLIKPNSINVSISFLNVLKSPYNFVASAFGIDISFELFVSVFLFTVNFDFKCRYNPLLS